jgi:excisionase family DNA binding protein
MTATHSPPLVIPGIGCITADLAKLLGTHQKTVARDIRNGKISAVKVAGTYFVPPEEVKRLVPDVEI